MTLDVLLVDSQDLRRARFSQILQMSGLKTEESKSCRHALQLLRTELPKVLLANLGLSEASEMDTFEFISQVRAAHPALKILAISGDSSSVGGALFRARAMGADAALPDAVRSDRLVELVRLMIGRVGAKKHV